MHLKLLSLFAAVLLLGACETSPEQTAGSKGTGASAGRGAQVESMIVPSPGTQGDLVANVGDRVFFDFDKSDLKATARRTLERQAAWLKKYPSISVTIQGHCDERGTREYNLALGERRATAIKNYLIALGVAKNRVTTISYGKERPAMLGHTEAAWSQNRRGVTVAEAPASTS